MSLNREQLLRTAEALTGTQQLGFFAGAEVEVQHFQKEGVTYALRLSLDIVHDRRKK